jgi:hypothetical protein
VFLVNVQPLVGSRTSRLVYFGISGGDFWTMTISEEILDWLPFTPLWSPSSVLQLVSELVKDHSTLTGS